MNRTVTLLPGTPNDSNREYLPEAIKNSDMVVNENGNNSQPYPKRLQECTGCLTDDGLVDRWYEYVPASYNMHQKVPLIVGCHGGLMTGWGHAIYTSWTMLADREGFICVFPDAHQSRIWQVEGTFENKPAFLDGLDLASVPKDYRQNHDLNFLRNLILKMQQKYNIDTGRIFMQGMSAGNLMTAQFCRYYGNMLAGAAGSGGPTQLDMLFTDDGNIRNVAGPLPVWQARPETNGTPPGQPYGESLLNRFNRFYWMALDHCNPIPQIRIEGEHNYAFYTGEKGDVVYHDIKNRDHGQTLDEAFLYWDYFFSGLHRNPDGSISKTPSNLPRTGDHFSVSVTASTNKAWFNNQVVTMSATAIVWQKLKYHGLNGSSKVRGEYICVPLSFLAKICNAQYIPSKDTLSAKLILQDGRILQFARGSIGCVIDSKLRSMFCEALHREGQLLVSIEWFCQYLMNWHVSVCDGVVYITDHFATLSTNMADVLHELLFEKPFPKHFHYMEYEETHH